MSEPEPAPMEPPQRDETLATPAAALIDAEVDTVPPPPVVLPQTSAATLLVGTSLLLAALNLRPPISSVAPVLPEIVQSTGLSALGASILTTLPVFCFGLFGPLAPLLARRLGTERAMFVAMIALTIGVGMRGMAGAPGLFAGQMLASIAIGVMNVLSPGLVKRDFPHRLPLMTGLYTMALCAGAAAGAGATVPIADRFGGSWSAALSFWAFPAVCATILWAAQLQPRSGGAAQAGYAVRGLWKDALAWQVTLFMGLQSALAFTVFGWLAPLLRDRGLSAVDAGLAVSISVCVQAAAALFAPILAARGKDQRLSCVLALAICVIGILGCFYAPLSTVWLWAVLLGLAQGSLFALALMIIVLRSGDAHVAAHLSGMAQSVGYLIAATGPMLTGLLYNGFGSRTPVTILFVGIALGAAIAALGAGRSAHVGAVTVRLPD